MQDNIATIVTLVVAVFTFFTSVLSLVKEYLDLKKIRKELGQIQVVANPREMREALFHALEGNWQVRGKFSVYQDIQMTHYSSGYANFIWDDTRSRYIINYSYAVTPEYERNYCVVAICSGYTDESESQTMRDGTQYITLKMQIDAIMLNNNIAEPQSKNYTMRTKTSVVVHKSLRELVFPLVTPKTKGEIIFSR